MVSVVEEIRKGTSRTFRKAYIKRRQADGTYESTWYEITKDVKKWGSIQVSTTPEKPGSFKFNTIQVSVANDQGLYNPTSEPSSLWFNYSDMQRTLFKLECGFIAETVTSGIWTQTYVPKETLWDVDSWDNTLSWDSYPVEYHGIISGDPEVNDKDEIILQIKPLTQIFKDYPARLLDGYTSTGMTSSQFITMVRDHTTGGGNFVFRPFFGDTTANWDIDATTQNFASLNTATAKDIRDKSVWDVMEKLAQADSMIPYSDLSGVFRYKDKNASTVSSSFFFGKGFFSPEYGQTIIDVSRFGPKLSAYYSRVQVRWHPDDTDTSYAFYQSNLTATGSNDPWVFGYRTFDVENYFIPSSAVADTIAATLFTDLSSLKKEITFQTSFIPHIKLLDSVRMSYDSSDPNPGSNWDENDWTTELTWDDSVGDAIKLTNKEFKIVSVKVDLDNFKSQYIGREA